MAGFAAAASAVEHADVAENWQRALQFEPREELGLELFLVHRERQAHCRRGEDLVEEIQDARFLVLDSEISLPSSVASLIIKRDDEQTCAGAFESRGGRDF